MMKQAVVDGFPTVTRKAPVPLGALIDGLVPQLPIVGAVAETITLAKLNPDVAVTVVAFTVLAAVPPMAGGLAR